METGISSIPKTTEPVIITEIYTKDNPHLPTIEIIK